MDPRAQQITDRVAMLSSQYGTPVTVTRIIQAATPIRNAFGTPTNSATTTFTANVIIDSQKINTLPTLVGSKPKEELRLIVSTGLLLNNDEFVMNGHAYKVHAVDPFHFGLTNVVDMVLSSREVD